MSDWFTELSDENRKIVSAFEKKGWSHGLRQLAVDKYPDPVHFVYELLQNAEDQEAPHVSFELTRAALIFYHDGKPFRRKDVENITGIGTSDKNEQLNKIGRFGIGFKSVFVVTDRPEVYTDLDGKRFSFAIEDIFVPVAQEGHNGQAQSTGTYFVLPFRTNEGTSIYETIQDKLCSRRHPPISKASEGDHLADRDP